MYSIFIDWAFSSFNAKVTSFWLQLHIYPQVMLIISYITEE